MERCKALLAIKKKRRYHNEFGEGVIGKKSEKEALDEEMDARYRISWRSRLAEFKSCI